MPERTMTDRLFVDPHIHLWDLAKLRYPWLTPPLDDGGPNGDIASIARTYLPADYLADASAWHIVGAVHIDAGAHPGDAIRETEWLAAQADATGLPTAIVAYAALDAPDVAGQLAAQAAHPLVCGIRQIVNWHADPKRTYTPRDVTGDAAWQRGFAQLAAHDLSFDLQCYPGQLAAVAAIAARHPDTRVILNHAGMPVDPDRAIWREGLRRLAALPNAAIKLSGFGFVVRDWTVEQIRPLILEAIEIFGTNRAMFASDFPTDSLFGSFDRHLDAYHAIVADFSDRERRALFADNANRVYRLGLELPPGLPGLT